MAIYFYLCRTSSLNGMSKKLISLYFVSHVSLALIWFLKNRLIRLQHPQTFTVQCKTSYRLSVQVSFESASAFPFIVQASQRKYRINIYAVDLMNWVKWILPESMDLLDISTVRKLKCTIIMKLKYSFCSKTTRWRELFDPWS